MNDSNVQPQAEDTTQQITETTQPSNTEVPTTEKPSVKEEMFNEIDKALNDYIWEGKDNRTVISTAGKTENLPEQSKTTEEIQQTEGKTEGTEPTTEETQKLEIPPIKWNGKELPLTEVIKEHPEVLNDIQKRFDYYKKTSQLADDRKKFDNEREVLANKIQHVILENLANDIGSEKTINDFLYATDEKGEFKYTEEEAEKEFNNYKEFIENKKKIYTENIEKTRQQNAEMENSFKEKYPDVNMSELFTVAQKYINPVVTKGQLPFPSDTLEIFYRGLNFNQLVEKERELERTKILKEIENKKEIKIIPEVKTNKQNLNSEQETGMMGQILSALDEYTKQ